MYAISAQLVYHQCLMCFFDVNTSTPLKIEKIQQKGTGHMFNLFFLSSWFLFMLPKLSRFFVGFSFIWLCLFLTRAVFCKGRKFDLCESYPRIIPKKITIMNVSFGIVWDCIGLTCYNGPDKLIDQCWPDPMIPGYLHIPSRSGESFARAQSL